MKEIEDALGILEDPRLDIQATSSVATISSEAVDQDRNSIIVKAQFLEEILKYREDKSKKTFPGENLENKKERALRLLMKNEINEIINVLQTQSGTDIKKHPKFYYWQKMFSISQTVPPQLLKKDKERKKKGKVIPATELVVVAAEDMFDRCMEIHNNVGKTGRQGMEVEAKKFYSNISRGIIEVFLTYSEEYQVKRKKTVNHGLVVKPILSEYYNSRVQIDLVDYSSLPDNSAASLPPYRYILNVQDHLTKFCHLRPLHTKEGLEVARNLYWIFCEFGAPLLLQSDNGLGHLNKIFNFRYILYYLNIIEFRNQIVKGLKVFWPGLEMVHGRSRRPQTQGSVERANGDFQPMLGTWMRENKNPYWSLGLPIVMHQKNRKFHSGIQTTPYNALFGKEAYNGLEFLNLPKESKEKVKTIKDLYSLLSGV